jgi:hypothetical protein
VKVHFRLNPEHERTMCGSPVEYQHLGQTYMLDHRTEKLAFLEVPPERRCGRCQRALDRDGDIALALASLQPVSRGRR